MQLDNIKGNPFPKNRIKRSSNMRNSLNSGMILKGIDSGINNKLRLKKRERVKSGKLGSQVGNSGFLVLCR